MSPPQPERSRRRAPAACTPCRKRHVRCIWSPTEGSPVRCQRCRERELDCVYEPTSVTGPPPTPMSPSLVPVSSSSHSLGFGHQPARPHHVGMASAYSTNISNLGSFPPKVSGQGESVNWNNRGLPAGMPFGPPPTHVQQVQSPYTASGSWRVSGTPSLTVQPSSYAPNYPPSRTTGMHQYSDSSWSTSPFSSTDSGADPFYDLLSQSPVHSNSQSPPMLDPPSRF